MDMKLRWRKRYKGVEQTTEVELPDSGPVVPEAPEPETFFCKYCSPPDVTAVKSEHLEDPEHQRRQLDFLLGHPVTEDDPPDPLAHQDTRAERSPEGR